MGFTAYVGRLTSHGAATVVVSLWVACNILLPTHFWLFKYNTLKQKGDVPFNLGTDPDTLDTKVMFKCWCVFLKVSCLLSYAMTALTMCRFTWTQLSKTWMRKYLCLDIFETIHKVSGVVGWLELLTVTALYLVNWGKLCEFYRRGNEDHNFCADFYSEIMMTGYLLTFFHTVIVVFSLRVVRRKRYEWFYWSHHLFIAIFLLSILHPIDWRHRRGGKERMQTWPVMIGPVTLYFIDRLIQMLTHTWTHCLKCTLIANPRTILLKLYAPRGYLKSRPGMVCWLNVPAVSWLNWHPYSIAHTDDSGCVYLMISCIEGGWSDKLWRVLAIATHSVPFRNLLVEAGPAADLARAEFVKSMTHAFNQSDPSAPRQDSKLNFLVSATHGNPLPDGQSPPESPRLLSSNTCTSYASSILRIVSTPVNKPAPTLRIPAEGPITTKSPSMKPSKNDVECELTIGTAKAHDKDNSDLSPGNIKTRVAWDNSEAPTRLSSSVEESRSPSQSPPEGSRAVVGTQTSWRAGSSQSLHDQFPDHTGTQVVEGEKVKVLENSDGTNRAESNHTDIWQKSATAEDIAFGLWQIRKAWSARYGPLSSRKVKVQPDFLDRFVLNDFDRAVWLGNLDLIRPLTKWPGDFGLSGPFTAGVTEAAHFDHSIMLGAGSGVLPFISHIKQFLAVKCPVKAEHPVRAGEKVAVYPRANLWTGRPQWLSEAIEYGPIWAFCSYVCIMCEFVLGVGALAMSVNKSIQYQTLGGWFEPFLMWSDWARVGVFILHKIAIHAAYGWNPQHAKRRGNDRVGAGSMRTFLFDWCLIFISLGVLLLNRIGTSTFDEVPSGGIMFALQWRHVCNLTSTGGYFCHFRQVHIPGIGVAGFVFVATFLCAICRMCRIWSQTPRLLSGGSPVPGVPEWEAEIHESQPEAMRLSTVDLVWVVRSPQWVEALLPELEDAISRRDASGRNPFTCQIFITDLDLVAGLKPDIFYRSPLRAHIQYGRPNLTKVALDICDSHMTSLAQGAAAGFFIAGPPSFQKDAKTAYLMAIDHVLDVNNGCGGNFSYHPEKFG